MIRQQMTRNSLVDHNGTHGELSPACRCIKKGTYSPLSTFVGRQKGTRSKSKSKSRGKSKKKQPLGLMQRNIYQNLDYYKSLQNTKARERDNDEAIYFGLFPNEEQMQSKPQLNQKTQKIYEKMKRQRNLSPNVFERLKTDEENRSRSKLVSIINRIKEVTPKKKISKQDLELFSTPKEMKYFTKVLNLKTE